MIHDVKLERLTVSSIDNQIAWSDDGLFAITTQDSISVIVSSINIFQ